MPFSGSCLSCFSSDLHYKLSCIIIIVTSPLVQAHSLSLACVCVIMHHEIFYYCYAAFWNTRKTIKHQLICYLSVTLYINTYVMSSIVSDVSLMWWYSSPTSCLWLTVSAVCIVYSFLLIAECIVSEILTSELFFLFFICFYICLHVSIPILFWKEAFIAIIIVSLVWLFNICLHVIFFNLFWRESFIAIVIVSYDQWNSINTWSAVLLALHSIFTSTTCILLIQLLGSLPSIWTAFSDCPLVLLLSMFSFGISCLPIVSWFIVSTPSVTIFAMPNNVVLLLGITKNLQNFCFSLWVIVR